MEHKIAFVIQRYGANFSGGAEYHCRQLALHLKNNYKIEVLTTCSKSAVPFDNYFNAGREDDAGVDVMRFRVSDLRSQEPDEVLKRIDELNIEHDFQLIKKRGPYCPDLIRYLINNHGKYQVVIFITSLFYTTVAGILLGFDNAILLPTAHDEPDMYRHLYDIVFSVPRGIFFNSIDEKQFIETRFPRVKKIPSFTTCVGINEFQFKGHKKENYLLYIGRICSGKGCNRLAHYFRQYKKMHPSDLKLYMAGSIENGYKEEYCEDIKYLGFITEDEKNRMLEQALLFMIPSKYESLSLVLLESLAAGTPVIVNGDCNVLRGQCVRSNAGLFYSSYLEFEAVLDYMLSHKEIYEQMCRNGIEFVKNEYNWDSVIDNINKFITHI
ncbi:MAG: glycosyltransferase family 4 protein [Lachnospiraceae bacterium]|nr:hypothetical protein C804_00501 [Lachnospiraceae bacterium A4]MCI8267334.1 glycosyltransferase family 4 protein [Lachnospiraceae bacterium]